MINNITGLSSNGTETISCRNLNVIGMESLNMQIIFVIPTGDQFLNVPNVQYFSSVLFCFLVYSFYCMQIHK